MSLGNGKLADTDQAVHFTGILVAEQRGGLTHAHRQVTIGTCAVQIDLILERAGHRTQGKAFLRLIIWVAHDEHAVKIMIPVTRNLKEFTLGKQRSLGQQVAMRLLHILYPTLQLLDDTRTLRQNDRQALTDGIYCGKVFQLTTQSVVVTFLCLFHLCQIFIQLILLRECNTINTLQGFTVGITTPICRITCSQLDGIALNASGGIQMRTGAQVGKFALLIERNNLVLRQVVDELNLIRLILHQLQCFRPGQLKTLHLELFLADFAHFCLNLLHDLRGERKWRIQVIIEAVVNRRTDCQLYLRVQALDSLCQNMGAGMPVCFAILLIFKRILIVCHEKFLLIFTGQKKNPTPDQNQGWDDNASHGSTLLGTAKKTVPAHFPL